ncbi:hypothetical protein [Geothermobacter hydrogeniphilus]|uniref:Tetratricopeptide repeat-containing protein n=1 Tax=Geothermobacter hydrogeniphilus TaxID=1969733 RepID=A0A1X0XXD6_9BACT|nr:hypothetical protein [Geothermobacter hydrogeniphilus]ORJ57574.1 hypothetical protein B5V00_13235 [Geothermobacter hydrogeniphilus]
MLSVLIAAACSAATSLALQYGAGFEIWVAILISLGVFAVVYFVLLRVVMKKVGVIMEQAQRDIQGNRAEKAVKTLEQAYKYGAWQFYVKQQVNSQIGTIYYLKRDFAKAYEYLEKGFFRHWVGMGMLAICQMRKKQTEKMIATFDKAIAGTKKEDMLWNLYAYCLDRVGRRDQAIKVLEKGLKKVSNKEALQGNLELLRAGKKMKMKQYGDMWLQFHLEKQGAIIKQQTRAMQGRRKIVRR